MQYYSTFVHCNIFSPQASQHLALLQLFSWSKKGVLGAGVCSTWWNVQGATEMWKIWWPAHSHGRTCQFLCGITIYAKVWQFCFENYVNLFLHDKYMEEISDALLYCHEKKVIHRDIKPENLLLGYRGELKIADFGWSVHAPSLRWGRTVLWRFYPGHKSFWLSHFSLFFFFPCLCLKLHRRRTMCGTLDYLPPEMVEGHTHSEKVDLWCVGVLCYECLVGNPPFETTSHKETYKRITKVGANKPHILKKLFKNSYIFSFIVYSYCLADLSFSFISDLISYEMWCDSFDIGCKMSLNLCP